MMEMGKQGCGAGSSCLGETLETPENFVGHGILVLQVDLLAQCAEIAIRREQRRRAVVLCQRKVERVIDVMAKQPCQLERSLDGRAVRFLSIDLPTFRQDPASSER